MNKDSDFWAEDLVPSLSINNSLIRYKHSIGWYKHSIGSRRDCPEYISEACGEASGTTSSQYITQEYWKGPLILLLLSNYTTPKVS